ncbi:unnamed protein product [Owenia fusiformis]|uniref:Telomerase reverse transcriptase n=1 Tax=Owenia fusiformis TaxID=6347 RepID=A0A8S4PL71_OWEFU|nr:unnamed protein product [Owenia fusiformis]
MLRLSPETYLTSVGSIATIKALYKKTSYLAPTYPRTWDMMQSLKGSCVTSEPLINSDQPFQQPTTKKHVETFVHVHTCTTNDAKMDILEKIYKNVHVLKDYLNVKLSDGAIKDALIQHGDNPRYKNMFKNTIVAYNIDNVKSNPHHSQHTNLNDVLMRVIQKLCSKGPSDANIISHGYRLVQSSSDLIECGTPLMSTYPNSQVSILLSKPWTTLHERIGDQVMGDILETVSIFYRVAPKAYIQLTGFPIHELVHVGSRVRNHNWNKGKNESVRKTTKMAKKKTAPIKRKRIDSTEGKSFKQNSKRRKFDCDQILPNHEQTLPYCVQTLSKGEQMLHVGQTQSNCEETLHDCDKSLHGGKAPPNCDISLHGSQQMLCGGQTLPSCDKSLPNCDKSLPNCDKSLHSGQALPNCDKSLHGSQQMLCGGQTLPSCDKSLPNCDKSLPNCDKSLHSGQALPNCDKSLHVSQQMPCGGQTLLSCDKSLPNCDKSLPNCDKSLPNPPKRRRKRTKKKNVFKDIPGSPYSYHQDLQRSSLFHTKCLRENLPNNYAMTKSDNGRELLDFIMQAHIGSTLLGGNIEELSTSPIKSPDFISLEEILDDALKLHRCCRYRALLEHFCPSKQWRNGKPGKVEQLLQYHTSQQQVYLYLRTIVMNIIPLRLFGCTSNRNMFIKNVRQLIQLGRYEKLCLGQLMNHMQVTKVLWLSRVAAHKRKEEYMGKVLTWLMEQFIFPVLRGFFYITESSAYKNRVFYFRKSLWKLMRAITIKRFKKNGLLKSLEKVEVEKMLGSGETLGVSPLRFVPKLSSLRPIANMRSRYRSATMKQGNSVNEKLSDLLLLLHYIKRSNPIVFGSGVFGLDDIYRAWVEFLSNRQQNHDNRTLYFVAMDIMDCYDTIYQKKLLGILSQILLKMGSEFIIRSYFTITTKAQKTLKETITPLTGFKPFPKFVKHQVQHEKLKNDVIFCDKVIYRHVSRDELLYTLQCHLSCNTLQIGRQYYNQQCGISQGSIISTLLCNIYYAHMEQSHLSVGPGELLLRQVDDFLYVTPELSKAQQFLDSMTKGFADYNCYMNSAKTSTNIGSVRGHISWCGLNLNTESLEVTIDFTRYNNVSLSDTITVDLSNKPGESLKRKLLFGMKTRCHMLLLDQRVNSLRTGLQTIYHIFTLTACKFHFYIMKLPAKLRAQNNPQYFAGVIKSCGINCYRHIQTLRKHKYPSAVVNIPEQGIVYMSYKAFLIRLGSHNGCYATTFDLLRAELPRLLKKCTQAPELLLLLNEVVHSDIPETLKQMI